MSLFTRILSCTVLMVALPAMAQQGAGTQADNISVEESCGRLFHNEGSKADAESPDPAGTKIESGAGLTAGQETVFAEIAPVEKHPTHLFLRANLLRWATLTPDLGVEWRVSRSVAVLVNGSWTSWSRSHKDRRYALWEVAPEVRWYLGKEKRGYLGAMYKVGDFNYKFSETGRQGDIMGGGITAGYILSLNKALSLDFSLGLGCIHADYEKYKVIEGVRVRAGKGTKNWWGPVSAGVTLTWNLF